MQIHREQIQMVVKAGTRERGKVKAEKKET